MKKTVVALLTAAVVSLGIWGGSALTHEVEVKPYVAVFTTPEFEWIWAEMPAHKPDKIVASSSWEEFDDFCREVKKEAKGKPIVIDLTVHGNDDGLALTVGWFNDITTVGYVINTIEQNVGSDNLTVLLEACYPGNAYYYTIRGNKDKEYNHQGAPKFPIYGVGSGFSNWANTVYLQYANHTYPYFVDLRTYEHRKPDIHEQEDRYDLSPTTIKLMLLFYKLYSLQS